MQYPFSLDKSSKKFLCPACNKRRFVRYKDNTSGNYLADYVGRCDRESSCGTHNTPKQFFQDNPFIKSKFWEPKCSTDFEIVEPHPKSNFINPVLVSKSLQHYQQNYFVQYLIRLFEKELAMDLVKKFQIGTSKRWKGATVFWQIDEDLKIRSGKVMLYNSKTGKRLKRDGKSYIDWVHSIMTRNGDLKDFHLQQCLFGMHQLNTESPDSIIGIVESEKTAVLMTALMPKMIWMACGSASNLKKRLLEAIQHRKIMLYPDLGAFEKWKEKLEHLQAQGFQIQISDLLERKATETDRNQGLDLADFFIKSDPLTGLALSENSYPIFWDSINNKK